MPGITYPDKRRTQMTRFIILLGIAVASFWLSCHGDRPSASEYDVYLDRAADIWHFQGSYLVARGDSILARGSRGFADIAEQRANTPETKFRIGSLTKPFTAIATLQLAERGLIDLDQNITAYINSYRPNGDEVITVHDLLSQRSGIPDLINNREYAQRLRDSVTPQEIVSYFQGQALLFPPGSRYAYSSSNYILLGLIIESVSGLTWQDYIEKHVCGPAGMNGTDVFPDSPARSDFAKGYALGPSGSLVEIPPIHPSLGYAAGALASTVDDLFRLNLALNDTILLNRRSIEAMFTPYSPTYGYAWIIDDFGGHRLIAHGGGVPGYVSIMQRWPDDSVCVIVLSNNANIVAYAIANALAAVALHEPYEMPRIKQPISVSPDDMAQYAGEYVLYTGEIRNVRLKAGKLYVQRGLGPAMLILPEAPDKFYFAHDVMTTLEFVRNSNDSITAQVIQQAFDRDTAWRAEQ